LADISKDRVEQLKDEIRMAEAINVEELQPIVIESCKRYMGDFTPPFGMDWDIVLNEVYPIIQNNLPSIFFRNPRAFLKPRNKTFIAKRRDPISGQMVETEFDSSKSAKTQEAILNYSLGEIKYKNETRRVLLDSLLFPHGVLWHGYKGDFGMTEEQSFYIKKGRVFVKRISPLRFIKDPMVNYADIDEARWVGRIIDIPLQDLIEDEKLNVEKKKIKGFDGYGQKIGKASYNKFRDSGGGDAKRPESYYKSLLDFSSERFRKSSACKFVRCYEIFLRPTKKEEREGSTGSILLLTFDQDKPLRENKWGINAEGFPSRILMFNEVPDKDFGIPDINTYKDVGDLKNVIRNIQVRNAQENSKTWVGISKEGTNEEEVQKVQQGDNTIVLFDSGNPRDRMFVASAGGGASSELYLIDQRLQKELEDKSGVTDLKRGALQSGEESAASVKIRNAGGSARPAYRQDIMADFLKESVLYINQLIKQYTPYEDAVRIVGSMDLEWSDNPTKEELQADVDVELDVISMLPENPEKELQQFGQALQLMMQGIQDPIIAQKLATEGKTLQLSPLIEQMLLRMRINNPDVFRNIRPEESEGFVSVQQIRQAKENVNAALTNQRVPYPPVETDDHVAKLEVYTSIQQLLQMAQQTSDVLEQLIQIQSALLQQAQEKNTETGKQVNLSKGGVNTF